MKIDDITYLIGCILAVPAIFYLAFGLVPLGYCLIRLAYRRRADLPNSWHDLWGLNRVNLVFFPERLDEQGQELQKRAVSYAKRAAAGIAFALAAFLLTKGM